MMEYLWLIREFVYMLLGVSIAFTIVVVACFFDNIVNLGDPDNCAPDTPQDQPPKTVIYNLLPLTPKRKPKNTVDHNFPKLNSQHKGNKKQIGRG